MLNVNKANLNALLNVSQKNDNHTVAMWHELRRVKQASFVFFFNAVNKEKTLSSVFGFLFFVCTYRSTFTFTVSQVNINGFTQKKKKPQVETER